MGLFDFLSRKKEPEYPKEYYWAQKSGEELRSESMPYVSFWNMDDSQEAFNTFWSKGTFTSGGSKEKGQKLEMACEKGDPEAPFYLAMFWKYGMLRNEVNNKLKIAPEKAEPYFYMAKERGSKMEQAYQYLLEHKVNPELDPDDRVATSMAFTAYGEGKHDQEVRRILGDDLYLPFAQLGMAMMAVGCNFGDPQFNLNHYDSAVCLAQLIATYARCYDNNGRKIKELEPFHENVMRGPLSTLSIEGNDGLRISNAILEHVIRLAARGDKTAAYVLQKYEVKV